MRKKESVRKIGLEEVMDALHVELAAAVKKAQGQDIVFPVDSVQLELQIGVTWNGEGNVGVKFWVLELGASANHTHESIQKVTINLQAPKYARELPSKEERPPMLAHGRFGPQGWDIIGYTPVVMGYDIDPMKPSGPTMETNSDSPGPQP